VTVGNIWRCRAHLPGNPSKNWDRGHLLRGAGRSTIDEEISEADKDVSAVVAVAHGAGISKKVAKLKPRGVVKG
jgi:tRNA-splicing ligase RtcB